MCKLVPLDDQHNVADIKLKYIHFISKQAVACKNISRIMLFGSSLEERCTERSDIDIAVFGKEKKTKYLRSGEYKTFQDSIFRYDLDQDYDILYFSENENQKGDILKDINQGIEIYRRAMA